MNYTPKQVKVMEFLRDYRKKNGVAPTLKEVGDALGISKVTVHDHLSALVKKGAIRRLYGQLSRAIEILDSEYLPNPTVKVMGRIGASKPIEVVEDPEAFTAEDLLPVRAEQGDYLLRVGDNSLADGHHIAEGDLLMVSRDRLPGDGELVVIKTSEGHRLVGFDYGIQLTIEGVVSGVLRRF